MELFHALHYLISLHGAGAYGHAEHRVVCRGCGCEFQYVAVRTVTGFVLCFFGIVTKRMELRAAARAQEKLQRALQSPDMIACPDCGRFQPDMVWQFRRWRLKVAFVASFAIFVLLGAVGPFLLKDATDLTPIASLVAIAALAWLLLLAIYVMRNPNEGREPERQARAAASQAVLLAEHQKRQAALQATEDPLDWMDAPNLLQQQKLADQRRRDDDRRQRRHRRRTVLSGIAVTLGAVLGALGDASLFGSPGNLPDRIAMTCLIAPAGGLIIWFLMTVGHAIRAELVTEDGWQPSPRGRAGPDISAVQARVVPACTALLAAFFATGMIRGTIHGYVVVMGVEAVLATCLALVMPLERG
jgi:hypothetical protein